MSILLFTIMDRAGQDTNKETEDINNIINLYSTQQQQNTFFSSAHGPFSRIAQMLGEETNHNRFRSTEIIQSIFLNHSEIKLEIIKEDIWETHKYVDIKQHTPE